MPSLSSFLGTNASRPKLTQGPSSSSSVLSHASARDANADFIFDEEQLPPAADPPPDLRELNSSLEALAVVFPDIQIDVFREMLANFDGESRLAVVADALLKNRAAWVKGRWRVPGKDDAGPDASGAVRGEHAAVTEADIFRTPEYKKAVKTLAWHEFKGLSRSAINAVLAEQNYSYLEARQTLINLSSKSWRFTISSIFLRRKPVATGEAETHPLILWRSSGQGSILPSFKGTGNAELDRELYHRLIAPLRAQAREKQVQEDRALAGQMNTEEAEATDSTYECTCCFTTATFEEVTTCDEDGHMVCFRCVRHTVTEAVFGQGWHRSIDRNKGTLRCPAMGSSECGGCIPPEHLRIAMLEEKKGDDVLAKLEERLAEHNLLASGTSLVRCPFCSYAEIDELYMPADKSQLRVRVDTIFPLFFVLLCLFAVPFLIPLFLFATLVALLLTSRAAINGYAKTHFSAAMSRARRRRRGLRFTCQAPRCGRPSCLACGKAWVDVHVCHEGALVALRTEVEQAMSMAVKRVCPRCATSFVKHAGCNKLTCPCGYRMCYVCRADIGADGYRHFCDHFRPEGDGRACDECDRCNLWEGEDTEAVLRAAREEAEQRWREREQRELSGAERKFLDTGLASQAEESIGRGLLRGKVPSMAEVLDWFVDSFFVA